MNVNGNLGGSRNSEANRHTTERSEALQSGSPAHSQESKLDTFEPRAAKQWLYRCLARFKHRPF
jgi:hypothetical protein